MGFVFIAANIFWLIEHKRNEMISSAYFRGLWDAFWWSVVTVTTVGYGDRTPSTHMGRTVANLWIVFGYLGFAWFTAMVTSAVTVSQLTGSIKGPGSLVGHSVGTTRGSTAAIWLEQNVPSAELKKYKNIETAYDRLLDRTIDAVVFDALSLLYFANHRGKEQTQLAGPIFRREEYGIVFPTNSRLREKINQALLKIQEDGSRARLTGKWFGSIGGS